MPDQERRKHTRVPVHIDITYDNDVVLTQANVKDLSLGGANIFTDAPLPVGTLLSIFFRGAEPGFELQARVLRVTEEDPDDEAAHPAMGIQFFDVSSQEEEAIQELIAWYLAQPPRVEPPEEAAPEELPHVEEVSEQRYIETQILPTVEAAPEATVQIKLPVEVSHPEPVDLETTQLETSTEEFEAQSPFSSPEPASPNPFAPPSEDAIETIRLSPEDLEAQRAARAGEVTAIETVRIHPEDLNALQSAAQDAASAIIHEHSDTTTTLPEMPAFNPDNDSGEHTADTTERKPRKKRKR